MASKEDGAKNTARRDLLLELQANAQAKWEAAKVFEVDAPTDVVSTPDNKFFGNFPYPYMNGKLHLGHAFSLSKLEFAAAFHRMQGKHVLFPFGFHCTGMPIKAAADKLDRECKNFGCPPVFPEPMDEDDTPVEDAPAAPTGQPGVFKAKKTKAAQKSGGEMYQWNILKSSNIDEAELPAFRDPVHWLNYFPPLGKEDITYMGCGVDWRRSFITTDHNPYYDAFVRWHMNTLYKMGGRIEKAKRFAVYSPLDGQPCADHDRASGEGVGAQEYVLIKMKVVQPTGRLAELAAVRDGKCFLAAATLRAETMYGQTNFWVLPEGDYGAYQMTDGEVFVLSARAARNMAFQDKTPQFGVAECLMQLKGTELLGCGVAAPLAVHAVIYGLPMLTILMSKGTGIVTSVPSDAPDDYMALQDLKKKPAMREKFGLKDEWVMPFDVIPIINIPEFGDTSAVAVCEELKIQSQNDRVKLDEAKNRTYLKGFYEGVMLVGEHKGMMVQEAKPLLRATLVADGRACLYSEPEKKVMSRSGEECVVALTDQWYLAYGEEEWLTLARECVGKMNLYSEENEKQFELTLGWLKQWALSRSFGLGTRLPWDPEFLVESLSDSTIYMAYYTIAHLLQEGDMFGYGSATNATPASLLTDELFDHIFLDKALPAECAVNLETVKKMKQEFEFWYPFDLRVSGKDLIQNHLTFTVYNHSTIFPQKHWPRAFRCNGHLMLNSEKMSKSTGNFKTLRQAINEYSADAMRMALADAGDGLEDANFVEATSNASILRLTKEIDWIELMLTSDLRLDGELFADRVFAAEMEMAVALTVGHYEALNFREALKSGWFDLQTARDTYRLTCGAAGMRNDLVLRFIETQTLLLGPLCPHTCEHVWGELLKRDTLLVQTPLPAVTMTAAHQDTVMAGRYLQDTVTSLRKLIQKLETPKKVKGGKAAEAPAKVTGVSLYVKDKFTGWHHTALGVLAGLFDATKKSFPDDTHAQVLEALAADPEAAASVQGGEKMLKKLAMPFVKFKMDEAVTVGAHVLQERLPFDEQTCLKENAAFIMQALSLDTLSAFTTTDTEAANVGAICKVSDALPGTPAVDPTFAPTPAA